MTEDSRPILQADEVQKHFGGVKAVEKVSLSVKPGSITSLIGPNGAGKTTFFNTVTQLIPLTGGRIRFDHNDSSHDLATMEPFEIARIGITRTFQNIRLFKDLSTLDNIKVGLHARTRGGLFAALWGNLREEREIAGAALHYLEFVGLLHLAETNSDSLSYGDQRRLEIARALASGPSLLLLDEPAAGMNPQETQELIRLINRIRTAGVTVFLIEHDMKVVMSISDYIYVMDYGELIAEGKAEEVKKNPKVVEAYLGPGEH